MREVKTGHTSIFFHIRDNSCDAVNAVSIGGQVECNLLHFDGTISETGMNVTKNQNDTTIMIKGNTHCS